MKIFLYINIHWLKITILTHEVKTLAAALSKWKPLTERILSANKDNTYNSPLFNEITKRSEEINATCEPSKLIFTPSCGSIIIIKYLIMHTK